MEDKLVIIWEEREGEREDRSRGNKKYKLPYMT